MASASYLARAQALAAGQTSTPAFVIGTKAGQGTPLELGSLDIGAFSTAIDPYLKR
ncbi:MAG: hypothetical protein QOG15_194 [Solirubrobacteraceae bacterium]|nr:hypothetical protein [Solirubrobacteraceae bacterium]